MAQKTILRPPNFYKPIGPFSLGIKVKAGHLIFLSGTVAWDAHSKLVGEGDIKTQTRKALENVKALLAEAGATLKDVVRFNYYFRDIIRDWQGFNEARMEFFRENGLTEEDFPASTGATSPLVRDDILVEIEAIAVTD